MENIEKDSFSLKRFFFGSIGKKISLLLGLLFLVTIAFVAINYNSISSIRMHQNYLGEVEVPLEVKVQQAIGYNALLTSSVHDALHHAEDNNPLILAEHWAMYNSTSIQLNNLLKIQIPSLLNQSKRTIEEKQKIYIYLAELNRINLVLADLEIRAFEAIMNGDIPEARTLIFTPQYDNYKDQLTDYYDRLGIEEAKISQDYWGELLNHFTRIIKYEFFWGLFSILFVTFLLFFAIRQIVNPIRRLTDATKELEKRNFNVNVDLTTGDEFEELGNTFNRTVKTLENLDRERNEIDKAKTEFLSITSHELRSPMTPMKAQLQMILGDYFGKLNKEQRESLMIVLNNTERLDKIIVDFLEISRIEAARLKFNFVKADLTKTIESVINEMKGFMPEKKIKIESKIDKLPLIEVDPDRVSQVLRNLINNAIKFSPENSRVEISAKINSDTILFSVRDSGVGISEKDQRRLFEPFYQAENMYQHKSGGTGLGLAISKGIVESQNGKIWLNSILGKGTIFYFTIPLKPVHDVKAIRLLFSNSAKNEEIIANIFREFIGPLGINEFQSLKESKGITFESVRWYIDDLGKKGILKMELAEEFKNKVALIFNIKEKVEKDSFKGNELDVEDLVKMGFVKK